MTATLEKLPRSDQLEGVPHPSETSIIFGQQAAINQFLAAFNTGRLHHAWMVTGVRGIGKATLTWQIAKFLLATPDPINGGGLFGLPEPVLTLYIDKEHPIVRRIEAGSEPGLMSVRRAYDEKRKKFKQMITVDEIRNIKSFFTLSATDGGRRVVILDCAEDMNQSAANALLKILEEPPQNAYLLLVSHQPARLLPTIRSRCRELRLKQLTPLDMVRSLEAAEIDVTDIDPNALEVLAGGSVGEAVKLMNLNGMAIFELILDIFETLPRLDNKKVIALSEKFSQNNKADSFEFFVSLLELALNRLALIGTKSDGQAGKTIFNEAAVFRRICPNRHAAIRWAELTQELSARLRHGYAVNLDPAALILDTFFQIEACAAKTAQ